MARDELARCYARFGERFGPRVLAALSGEPLLRTMYDGSSRDSLAYWLERGDKVHPAGTFGLISGGTPLAIFGLYRRSGMDVWVAGRHYADEREVPLSEAIDIVSRFRDQLLAACAVLEQFPATTDDGLYAGLQADLDRAARDLSNRVWLHKYLHMLRPDALEDFHNEELQEAHLISLLEVPPRGDGRYLRAGRYVRIAGELGWPINHLACVLNHRRTKARLKQWLTPASVARRDGEVRLACAHALPEGTVFVTCDGREVTAIGQLQADHARSAAAGAEVWTPVRWLDESRWRLPEAERGGETVKRLTSAVNRVAIERRILDVTPSPSTTMP